MAQKMKTLVRMADAKGLNPKSPEFHQELYLLAITRFIGNIMEIEALVLRTENYLINRN